MLCNGQWTVMSSKRNLKLVAMMDKQWKSLAQGALKLQNTGWIQQCGVAWVVEDGGGGEDGNMGAVVWGHSGVREDALLSDKLAG